MTFLRRIFDLSPYTSALDRDRARMIYSMTSLLVILFTLFGALRPNATTGRTMLEEMAYNPLTAFAVVALYLVAAFTFWATRTGRLGWAAFGPLIAMAGPLLLAVQTGFFNPASALLLPLVILLTGFLIQKHGLWIGALIATGALIAAIAHRTNLSQPSSAQANLSDFVSIFSEVLFIVGLVYLFLRFARLSRLEGQAMVRRERLTLADITSQIARRISQRLSLNDVLTNAVEQIRDSYPDVYHAQIFLLDESRQNAQLVASTGDVGRLLLERRHSLPVGSPSVIGQVTAQSKPVIARAGASQTIHRRNELLPDTVVEAAFPLRLGNRVIGALDMQSKVEGAFQPEDNPVFQSLADHLAIAIDNARLFEATEQQLKENQQLVEQSRQYAQQVERLNKRLTESSWEEYLAGRQDVAGLTVDFTNAAHHRDHALTPTLQSAMRQNYLVQTQADDKQVIALPVRVRGQVIGAMEFELDPDGQLTPEDLQLIEDVSEQFGLVVESNRLFEVSQRAAQREALVNEIAARLQASPNVEMTLNEAARSLKNTLRANKVAIRLGRPPTANGDR